MGLQTNTAANGGDGALARTQLPDRMLGAFVGQVGSAYAKATA